MIPTLTRTTSANQPTRFGTNTEHGPRLCTTLYQQICNPSHSHAGTPAHLVFPHIQWVPYPLILLRTKLDKRQVSIWYPLFLSRESPKSLVCGPQTGVEVVSLSACLGGYSLRLRWYNGAVLPLSTNPYLIDVVLFPFSCLLSMFQVQQPATLTRPTHSHSSIKKLIDRTHRSPSQAGWSAGKHMSLRPGPAGVPGGDDRPC